MQCFSIDNSFITITSDKLVDNSSVVFPIDNCITKCKISSFLPAVVFCEISDNGYQAQVTTSQITINPEVTRTSKGGRFL